MILRSEAVARCSWRVRFTYVRRKEVMTSGCRSKYRFVVTSCRHELPTRPQVPFVQDHLRIRFLNQPGPPGFRDPGAIDLAQLEQSEDLRICRVDDVDV